MEHQELVHEEEYKGFTIKLYLLPEYDRPDWDMTEEEWKTIKKDISNGMLLWFCAKVSAELDGHEFGTDYLGQCCYASVKDFMQGGYYVDMRDIAVDEAKAALKMLQSKIGDILK